MHLLVLGALWSATVRGASSVARFDAPFGARCFPTDARLHQQDLLEQGVLMRLLALGAF